MLPFNVSMAIANLAKQVLKRERKRCLIIKGTHFNEAQKKPVLDKNSFLKQMEHVSEFSFCLIVSTFFFDKYVFTNSDAFVVLIFQLLMLSFQGCFWVRR